MELSGVPPPRVAKASAPPSSPSASASAVQGEDPARGERFFVQLAAPEPVELDLGPLRLAGRVRYARVSPDGSRFVWKEPA